MAVNLKADSSDTETAEKRPPVLYDLPIHILEQVKGELPLIDCLSLRKVSRDLRNLVDSTPMKCNFIEFEFGYNFRTMRFNNLELKYQEVHGGYCEIISNRLDIQGMKVCLGDGNYKQAMTADALTFLNNPKLDIGHMAITSRRRDMEPEFMEFIKSLNLRLNVRLIQSTDLEFLHSTQEFLNPEKLEEMLFARVDGIVQFNEINLEILKNPKLKFEKVSFDNYSDESSSKFLEVLNSLNFQLNIQIVHVFDERWIPTNLQYSNPEKVEKMIIDECVNLTVDQFNAIAGKKQWKTKTTLQFCPTPEGIGLEELVDFRAIRNNQFELTEENLIKIRDILLKSNHLQMLELIIDPHENIEYQINVMNERIERVMIEDPSYDASTRRFSIPNTQDYFQLTLGEKYYHHLDLTIERVSSLDGTSYYLSHVIH